MKTLILTNNQEFPDKELFYEIMNKKTYLEPTYQNVALTNDWIRVWKPECHSQKYGLWIWSNSLQKLRGTTMGEFYGNGIVD